MRRNAESRLSRLEVVHSGPTGLGRSEMGRRWAWALHAHVAAGDDGDGQSRASLEREFPCLRGAPAGEFIEQSRAALEAYPVTDGLLPMPLNPRVVEILGAARQRRDAAMEAGR